MRPISNGIRSPFSGSSGAVARSTTVTLTMLCVFMASLMRASSCFRQ